MKEKIRITSKVKQTTLLAQSMINGIWQVLTPDFYQMSKTELETNPKFKGVPTLSREITPLAPFFEFEYDTEDIYPGLPARKDVPVDDLPDYEIKREANELNRRKHESVKNFWLKHNQIEHAMDFGSPFKPTSEPIFYVEILTQKARNNFYLNRKRIEVWNRVMEMTWPEQYDLALYYEPSLANKRRSEVLSGLLELKGIGLPQNQCGVLMRSPLMDDFLTKYKEGSITSMKVKVNKAIAMKILSLGKGGYYLDGSMFVGKEVNDIISFFSRDMDSYNNNLLRAVNEKDKLPEDDIDTETPVKGVTKSKFIRDVETAKGTAEYYNYSASLRNLAEAIGIHTNRGTNELSVLVEKKVDELVEMMKEESLPTSKLEQTLNDLATKDINKLKTIARDEGVPHYDKYKSVDAIKDAIKAKRKEKEVPVE